MRAPLPFALIMAGLLAACQQTAPTNIRTGEGMVDPVSGRLDPAFVDGTFSLSILIEEHLRQPLENSDRREIDIATDAAMSGAPQDPAVVWRNPVRRHQGEVDLVSWRIDTRAGELCGVIQHESGLDKTLRGSVTICRASIDPAWRVDEVVWDGRRATYTPPIRPTPAPVRPKPVVTTEPPVATPSPQPQPPVNYGPGSDPGPQPSPSNKDCNVPVGSGSITLGDCLAPPSS